jgi:hypothetical protein
MRAAENSPHPEERAKLASRRMRACGGVGNKFRSFPHPGPAGAGGPECKLQRESRYKEMPCDFALGPRIGVRKHAVLRTAMRGDERECLDRPANTLRSFPRTRESRTTRQAVQFALDPRLRGDERENVRSEADSSAHSSERGNPESATRILSKSPWTPAIGVQSTPFFERLCAGVSGEACEVPDGGGGGRSAASIPSRISSRMKCNAWFS